MLAARRRPGKLPDGFYAAAEKEADRAMHTAVRKESRPRPRPLSNKTDWSHAKIKIGPRHQASLPRLDRRRPPPAEGRGGSIVEDPAALEREMAIRGKDWSPETAQKFERAVRKYGDDLDKIRKSVGTRLRRVVSRRAEIKLRGATLAARLHEAPHRSRATSSSSATRTRTPTTRTTPASSPSTTASRGSSPSSSRSCAAA